MEKAYPHHIELKEKKCKLIACEVMFREICFLLSQTHNVVDVVFARKGLHDAGKKRMEEFLQAEIDKTDPEEYAFILLAYGLCNNGVCGLFAKIPIVIPRAHDCITLLLGSKERYKEYFSANPGTYYKSSGWIEREANFLPQSGSVMDELGIKSYEEYVEEYGEENAQYLMETLGGWVKNYNKMTYIDVSIIQTGGNTIHFGDSDKYREKTKQKAAECGWEYEEIKGDIRLLEKLLNGDWNRDEFLIVPPDKKIISSYTDEIVSFE